jgi:hypothetical protein
VFSGYLEFRMMDKVQKPFNFDLPLVARNYNPHDEVRARIAQSALGQAGRPVFGKSKVLLFLIASRLAVSHSAFYPISTGVSFPADKAGGT